MHHSIKNLTNHITHKHNMSLTMVLMLFVFGSFACSKNSDRVEFNQKVSLDDNHDGQKQHNQTSKPSDNVQSVRVKIIRAQEDIEQDKRNTNTQPTQTEKKPLVNPKDVELTMMMQLSLDKEKAKVNK